MPIVSPSYDYSTGKISISPGDNVVVGSGLGATGWGGAIARRGDVIILDRGGANEMSTFVINPVVGVNNQLEIPPYNGPELIDVDYCIYWISPTRVAGSEAVEDITRLVNFLNTSGIYVYVDSADAEPDPSLGEEGQSALQPSTGKVWTRTGGEWIYQGTFKGLNPRGEYDAGTSYNTGDIVSRTVGGSSYISRVDGNVGNDPATSPDEWMLNSLGLAGPSGATIIIQNDQPTTEYTLNSIWIDADSPTLKLWQLVGEPKAWADTGVGIKGDQGIPGEAATIGVAGAVSLPPGSTPTVENVGTSNAASLAFGIPQGDKGDTGSGIQFNAKGTTAGRSAYDGEAEDFVYLAIDVVPNQYSIKNTATSGDWSAWSPIGGDMARANYDPDGIASDVYDFNNIKGVGATGKLLSTATTADDALDTLEVGATGSDLFKSTTPEAAKTILQIEPGVPDDDRRNLMIDRIFQSKLMGDYRRNINAYADGFKSTNGVDPAGSSGHEVDTTNGKVSVAAAYSEQTSALTGSGNASLGYTIVDRSYAIDNDQTISKVGVYSASAGTFKFKIMKENSSTSYDVVVSEGLFNHGGTGLEFFPLSTPYVVPSTGTYRSAVYAATGLAVAGLPQLGRSYKSGDITGTGQTGFATTAGGSWATAVVGPLGDMVIETVDIPTSGSMNTCRALVMYNFVDTMALNTDFQVEVSCDDGAHWQTATLTEINNGVDVGASNYSIAETDEITCVAGTTMKVRAATTTAKDMDIFGIAALGKNVT